MPPDPRSRAARHRAGRGGLASCRTAPTWPSAGPTAHSPSRRAIAWKQPTARRSSFAGWPDGPRHGTATDLTMAEHAWQATLRPGISRRALEAFACGLDRALPDVMREIRPVRRTGLYAMPGGSQDSSAFPAAWGVLTFLHPDWARRTGQATLTRTCAGTMNRRGKSIAIAVRMGRKIA